MKPVVTITDHIYRDFSTENVGRSNVNHTGIFLWRKIGLRGYDYPRYSFLHEPLKYYAGISYTNAYIPYHN